MRFAIFTLALLTAVVAQPFVTTIDVGKAGEAWHGIKNEDRVVIPPGRRVFAGGVYYIAGHM